MHASTATSAKNATVFHRSLAGASTARDPHRPHPRPPFENGGMAPKHRPQPKQ